MKILNILKRFFAGFIGVIFTLPAGVRAEENKGMIKNAPSTKEENVVRTGFSQDELIGSLRKMRRHPEKIKTVCAMCYDMVGPPREVEFQCGKCGRITVYSRESAVPGPESSENLELSKKPQPGILAEKLPYIKRSLAQTPYKVSVDLTGLCPVCGKGKDQVLVMAVSCFNCGREFSWEVKGEKDINMLRWLYLKFPINEVDITELDIRNNIIDGVRGGAEYIYGHVFCPDCRKKINIEEGIQ